MLPACPALLVINNITVTNDFKNQLKKAFVEPRYLQYLHDKFKWPDHCAEIISWKALKIGLKRVGKPCLAVLPMRRKGN